MADVADDLRRDFDVLKQEHEELRKDIKEVLDTLRKDVGGDQRGKDTRADDRKGRDTKGRDDEGDRGSIDERFDHLERMLREVLRKDNDTRPFEGDKGKDARGRDESEEKRHEDEVRGGEKANAELEGEHREEKKMRADDRKGRDTRGKDEDEAKRHRDDVRGGEVAEGEYKERHGEGEKFDDHGVTRDAKARDKCRDRKGRDADDDDIDEEQEAIELTIDEANDNDPLNVTVGFDRAFNKVASDLACVSHAICPELSIQLSYNKDKSAVAQRKQLDYYRKMVIMNAMQNEQFRGVALRAMDGKHFTELSPHATGYVYNEIAKRARRKSQANVSMVDMAAITRVNQQFGMDSVPSKGGKFDEKKLTESLQAFYKRG